MVKHYIKINLILVVLLAVQFTTIGLANEGLLDKFSFLLCQVLLVTTAGYSVRKFYLLYQAEKQYQRGVSLISQRLNKVRIKAFYGELHSHWKTIKKKDNWGHTKDIAVFEQKRI